MNTERRSRNPKNLPTKTRGHEDSDGQERVGSLYLCDEDRMPALPGGRKKILAGSRRIFGLVAHICVCLCSSVVSLTLLVGLGWAGLLRADNGPFMAFLVPFAALGYRLQNRVAIP